MLIKLTPDIGHVQPEEGVHDVANLILKEGDVENKP